MRYSCQRKLSGTSHERCTKDGKPNTFSELESIYFLVRGSLGYPLPRATVNNKGKFLLRLFIFEDGVCLGKLHCRIRRSLVVFLTILAASIIETIQAETMCWDLEPQWWAAMMSFDEELSTSSIWTPSTQKEWFNEMFTSVATSQEKTCLKDCLT